MTPKTLTSLLSLGLLTNCGGNITSDISTITISKPFEYLAQSKNPDGNTTTPLISTDPLTYRRKDFSGGQISDSFLTSDGAITTWSYYPFGIFTLSNGDGGEKYILDNSTLKIFSTQDGSKPYIQYFCGGTGWILFKTDADQNWKQTIATLAISSSLDSCPTLNLSLTKYKRALVNYPSLGEIDSIISEHYNKSTLSNSTSMERFFFARGWGRLIWQAWGKSVPSQDLSTKCPDIGLNNPPSDNWYLQDCRITTNIIISDGSLTGNQEWHPN